MFFVVSKILGFFASPSNFIVCVGLLGVALAFTRWRRIGHGLAGTSLVLLALAGLSPLGDWLIAPLENRFPPWDPSRGAPDGIVVLGGAISPDLSIARGATDLNDAAERITAATALARAYPAARIIYSGGNGRLLHGGGVEAEIAADLFDSIGLPRARVTIERRSRNTAENAEFSKALANPKPGERWLVVTSAFHMARSVALFRRAGFPVEAYPVDWRGVGGDDVWLSFESASVGLTRTDTAVREWTGLIVYRLTGKTSVLFPAP